MFVNKFVVFTSFLKGAQQFSYGPFKNNDRQKKYIANFFINFFLTILGTLNYSFGKFFENIIQSTRNFVIMVAYHQQKIHQNNNFKSVR